MSYSRNIWWNLAYPLTVNRVRLSAPLTLICWHLRLGRRLGAFQIHTIRWRHSRLAPLTVTVTVSVAFRNVSNDVLCLLDTGKKTYVQFYRLCTKILFQWANVCIEKFRRLCIQKINAIKHKRNVFYIMRTNQTPHKSIFLKFYDPHRMLDMLCLASL